LPRTSASAFSSGSSTCSRRSRSEIVTSRNCFAELFQRGDTGDQLVDAGNGLGGHATGAACIGDLADHSAASRRHRDNDLADLVVGDQLGQLGA
jgi:hypothetical protein